MIELLIVVAIIGFLSAVAIPSFLAARDKARGRTASPPAPVQTLVRPKAPEGPLPLVDRYQVAYQLGYSFDRVGMEVFARTTVKARGQVQVRRPPGARGPMVVQIPIPAGRPDVRDVRVNAAGPGVGTAPGSGATPRLTALEDGGHPTRTVGPSIELTLAPPSESAGASAPTTVEFSYTALGRDALAVWLPAAEKLDSVKVEIDVRGAESLSIPDRALQPTHRSPDGLRWELEQVGTAPPIVIEIPAAQSPLGRVVTLFQLTGLAVMLFGLGVWYLAELEKPGLLWRFRLAHFLLLALNFSLYFVIFAVISFREDLSTGPGMVLSGALSLPLLVLHVARFTNREFAVARMLPLAICSLALVISGVFLGPSRDWVFLFAAVSVTAFVTITFERWAAARQAFADEQAAAVKERIAAIKRRLSAEADRLMDRANGAECAAGRLQEAAGASAARPEVQALGRLRRPVRELAKSHEHLQGMLKSLDRPGTIEEEDLAWWDAELPRFIAQATAVVEPLEQAVESVRSMGSGGAEGDRCAACGRPGLAGAYCAECGARAARRITCACGESFMVPLHALRPEPLVLHCVRCGTLHMDGENRRPPG